MSNLDRGTGSQDVLRDVHHLLQTSSGPVAPLGHDQFPIYSNLTFVYHPIIRATVSKGVITLAINYKM